MALEMSTKMPMQRRLLMMFMLLGALLLSAPPSVVTAQEESYAYYWSLTFDFDNSATGRLYVAVGYEEDGDVQEPPIYTQNYAVPCTRKGNAGVTGGMLKLEGGYLSCDLDVLSALEAAVAACNAIAPGCSMDIQDVEHYDHFRGEATVMSTNPGVAPIFYHDDASYAINPQSSTTQITGSLSPHGVIPSTSVMSVPIGVWHDYAAFYTCGGACGMQYSAAGGFEVVPTASEEVPFFTPSSTIYIGYDPITNTSAPAGTYIDFLFIDPPNHGND